MRKQNQLGLYDWYEKIFRRLSSAQENLYPETQTHTHTHTHTYTYKSSCSFKILVESQKLSDCIRKYRGTCFGMCMRFILLSLAWILYLLFKIFHLIVNFDLKIKYYTKKFMCKANEIEKKNGPYSIKMLTSIIIRMR